MRPIKNTKERILEEAIKLFVRRGYHGTTIDNIVKEVGLTKGAFYSHFSSKGQLLLEIIRRYKIKLLDQMVSLSNENPGNALEKLNQIISFNARFAAQNENLCIFLSFLSTELATDVDFEPALKAVYREYTNLICKLIREGIDQGLLKKEMDPDLAAITFIALHDGVLHQWIVNRDSIDAEKYVRTFRRIFMSGIQREDTKLGKR
jgi:AcrR family transcriptional regulator